MYPNISNVTHDMFTIIPHGVKVVAAFCIGSDIIRGKQSITIGRTIHKKVIVSPFAPDSTGMSAFCNPALDATNFGNDLEMK